MIRLSSFVLAFSLICALGACSDDPGDSPEQRDLSQALESWSIDTPDHYQYVARRSCECLPEVGMPIIVEVQNGAVVSAVYEADLMPVSAEVLGLQYTIDDLFGVIQDAVDEGAYRIDVTYNGDRGYPETIGIDYEMNIADEEFYLDVRNFELLASVGI